MVRRRDTARRRMGERASGRIGQLQMAKWPALSSDGTATERNKRKKKKDYSMSLFKSYRELDDACDKIIGQIVRIADHPEKWVINSRRKN